jgi:hypothetical protein
MQEVSMRAQLMGSDLQFSAEPNRQGKQQVVTSQESELTSPQLRIRCPHTAVNHCNAPAEVKWAQMADSELFSVNRQENTQKIEMCKQSPLVFSICGYTGIY